jgi:asparagine synthase (glutamine-hydrolysing)
MSIQLGRWHFQSAPPAPSYLEKVQGALAGYGPDGTYSYSEIGVDILYAALHTTKESRREKQPQVTASGIVVTWDGRLDNRATFLGPLGNTVASDSPDVSIVASAYERWGTSCLALFVGDWALSIWDPHDRSLILAKDPIGTRPLYYSIDQDQVTWCSILDPLVLFAGKSFKLNEEYIAGWFSSFPATHLTPYVGIESVAPSSFVRLAVGQRTVSKYWEFDPDKRIRYSTDAEYEEHFRAVFRESVRRRLRSDSPILAELSGGMDSSSIVCMADTIVAQGSVATPRLDTLSYFNDSEPNWNERPYFSKVEEKRGRIGFHIDLGCEDSRLFQIERDEFRVAPGFYGRLNKADRERAASIRSGGYRVVLSGIGGDEVTGGVPSPTSEVANLIARAHLRTLARQLKLWALAKRKPWFHLLLEAASHFLPYEVIPAPEYRRPPLWVHPNFARRYRFALAGYESRLKLFGPLPSFQQSTSTLDALRRQITREVLSHDPPYDRRYPYLDRDLLEFVCAIPREQLVRPGQRRSLMRRALAGIVPEEILNRRRKAYVSRAPMTAFSKERDCLAELSTNMVASSLGIVNAHCFRATLQRAREGHEVPVVTLLRTIELEIWLRGLLRWRGLEAAAAESLIDLRCGERSTALPASS